MLCDNLEGWDGGERWEAESRGKGHMYTYGWCMVETNTIL